MRRTIATAAVFAFSVAAFGSTAVDAKACKDAKTGRFTKCPVAAAPAKPVRCKDAKGKFTKCAGPDRAPGRSGR
jgi:hypothetical protein